MIPLTSNPLPKNPQGGLRKMLWEKEKMLITSIFSFFLSLFLPHQKKKKKKKIPFKLLFYYMPKFSNVIPSEILLGKKLTLYHTLIPRFNDPEEEVF